LKQAQCRKTGVSILPQGKVESRVYSRIGENCSAVAAYIQLPSEVNMSEVNMEKIHSLSRRNLFAVGAAGAVMAAASAANAASFGNPDEPAEGAVNVTNPKALADPCPQDSDLAGKEPSFINPPATDVNGMAQFWSSFNLAPKRIQNGGWARQITADDFKISTTIAGVNMRLGPGGVRELHWHQQAEWAIMTYGNCRVTILDEDGRPEVADVKEGDLWYFPAGLPHSLQGIGMAASLSSRSIMAIHQNSIRCC
jgi:oxalate decarboxylase